MVVNPRKLPDSQVFDRDPESWDDAAKVDFKERITKILDRLRSAKPKEVASEPEDLS